MNSLHLNVSGAAHQQSQQSVSPRPLGLAHTHSVGGHPQAPPPPPGVQMPFIGPPPMRAGHKPLGFRSDLTNLYVNNMPALCNHPQEHFRKEARLPRFQLHRDCKCTFREEHLEAMFCVFGEIVRCTLFDSQGAKSYGFVQFYDKAAAVRSQQLLNNSKVPLEEIPAAVYETSPPALYGGLVTPPLVMQQHQQQLHHSIDQQQSTADSLNNVDVDSSSATSSSPPLSPRLISGGIRCVDPVRSAAAAHLAALGVSNAATGERIQVTIAKKVATPLKPKQMTKLIIRNLPRDCTREDLEVMLARLGIVTYLSLYDVDGHAKYLPGNRQQIDDAQLPHRGQGWLQDNRPTEVEASACTGFVRFDLHEDCRRCIDQLHDKPVQVRNQVCRPRIEYFLPRITLMPPRLDVLPGTELGPPQHHNAGGHQHPGMAHAAAQDGWVTSSYGGESPNRSPHGYNGGGGGGGGYGGMAGMAARNTPRSHPGMSPRGPMGSPMGSPGGPMGSPGGPMGSPGGGAGGANHTKVLVKNVPPRISQQEFQMLFQVFGAVSCALDPSIRMGLVRFASAPQANAAVTALNGVALRPDLNDAPLNLQAVAGESGGTNSSSSPASSPNGSNSSLSLNMGALTLNQNGGHNNANASTSPHTNMNPNAPSNDRNHQNPNNANIGDNNNAAASPVGNNSPISEPNNHQNHQNSHSPVAAAALQVAQQRPHIPDRTHQQQLAMQQRIMHQRQQQQQAMVMAQKRQQQQQMMKAREMAALEALQHQQAIHDAAMNRNNPQSPYNSHPGSPFGSRPTSPSVNNNSQVNPNSHTLAGIGEPNMVDSELDMVDLMIRQSEEVLADMETNFVLQHGNTPRI